MGILQRMGKSYLPRQERRRRIHFCSLLVVLMTPTRAAAFAISRQIVLQQRRLSSHPPSQSTLSSGANDLLLTETSTRALPNPPVSKIFDLILPEGRCVGLTFTDQFYRLEDSIQIDSLQVQENWINDVLHEEEVRYARNMPGAAHMNQLSFILGRMAMRTIITESSSNTPILKDAHGRPTLPNGYLGSISHKKNTAVALVARHDGSEGNNMGIGIDLEYAIASKARIATRVLTSNEMESLGCVEGVSASEEVLLRFSLKESLYKAMHPLLDQYVGFQQVQVQPLSDGSARAQFNFTGCEQLSNVTCHWKRVGEFFLSSASLTLKEENRRSSKTDPETT